MPNVSQILPNQPNRQSQPTQTAKSQRGLLPAVKPQCENCNDTKYYRYDVPMGHIYFGKLFPCPICNKQTLDRNCGLNGKERLVKLDDIDTTNRTGTAIMKAACVKFAASPVGFLSLHGGNGTGKTMALMGLVNSIIDGGGEARYMTASELLAIMRETFDSNSHESDYERVRKLATVQVLCIDEVDKLRDTPYSREIQNELINLRYRQAHVLGTVLAWNGEFTDLPLPAVASRLSEFIIIKNNDADIRKLIGGMK